ncbi:hypothetical protein K440DRAFT_641434 [Wilcoxina mikolae CBS 423.85]|nr:hypothetical protein K440DRAFT_641434 [Wilcoxina mikolae CBS 423.85]
MSPPPTPLPPSISDFAEQLIRCVVRFAISADQVVDPNRLDNAIEITPFLIATQLEDVRELLRHAEEQEVLAKKNEENMNSESSDQHAEEEEVPSKKTKENMNGESSEEKKVKKRRKKVYKESEGFYIGGYDKTFWVEANGGRYSVGKGWDEYSDSFWGVGLERNVKEDK